MVVIIRESGRRGCVVQLHSMIVGDIQDTGIPMMGRDVSYSMYVM